MDVGDDEEEGDCEVERQIARMQIQVAEIPTKDEDAMRRHAFQIVAQMSASMRAEARRRKSALQAMLSDAPAERGFASEHEHLCQHMVLDLLYVTRLEREAAVLEKLCE